MTAGEIFTNTWSIEPSVIVGCLGLLLGYYWLVVKVRPAKRSCVFWFTAGIQVLLLALISPLETLGDNYLFSTHMAQHLLLVLVVPVLLIKGLPPELVRGVLRWRWTERLERFFSRPLITWQIGVLAVWLWHLPVLYEATLQNQFIHINEHLFFLVTAVIFWWPVFNPIAERRPASLGSMLYLLTAALASTLLGIILTFAPAGIYPTYVNPVDTFKILPVIRGEWGLTPTLDQQLGGILMWVPGSTFYLISIIAVFLRWHAEQERTARSFEF